MKLLKKSIEVDAVLFDKDNVPSGIMYEGFDPATGEFREAYLQTPVGKLPIKHGDYVLYENGKTYPCTLEAMEQNFTEYIETPQEDNTQITFESDGVKHGHLCLSDEGELIFSGGKKKSAESFMVFLQKSLIDPYIQKNAEQVKIDRAFRFIDEQVIGTSNYFLSDSGRSICLNCNKKGNVLLLLRNGAKDKRLYVCKECVVKFILAVKENKHVG